VLECVINVSEGCDARRLADLDQVCGRDLLDRHSDCDHHRSVFTLVGEAAGRELTTRCVDTLRLDDHRGVHPRLGVVDVVPFVPLDGSSLDDARRARDDFARWAATELELPVFVYGPADKGERQLPDVRRDAWTRLAPDFGPHRPHPTAGAICAGFRRVLVAYNVWLDDTSVDMARVVARDVRGDGVRALGLAVGTRMQVSMNLIDPHRVGPLEAFERVESVAQSHGVTVAHGELVGLIPGAILERVPEAKWKRLDLDESRTIEARRSARD
jgi:glutamate formiminotransferase